ncbi:MAG: nitrate transporter substrate-binding protein [Microbacteriaceae bacterium]|jgi:hypothetical protein|nr:nitrate transporter substrate-binding protein [Microbacteriaceae bacterium]
MRSITTTRIVVIGVLTATAITLAACSAPSEVAPQEASAERSIGPIDLSDVCPATIVIQDSWYPQAELGGMLALIATDYTVDASNKSVSGPLVASDEYTGVNLELRAGGPAIGFTPPVSQMYQDTSITLARMDVDSAIQNSADLPTISIFAALDVSPLSVMWSTDYYPDVKSTKDLGEALAASGGVFRYNQSSSAYLQYLIRSGQLPESVVDGSYDGTPGNFVASGGKDSQQGYATNEPYVYDNIVTDWGKPLSYELLSDTGWDVASGYAIRTSDLDSMSECLTELVPIFQQSTIDYFAEPAPASALLIDLVEQYQTGAIYDHAVIDYANEVMISEGLVGNGSNDAVGDYDEDRVSKLIDIAVPVYTEMGQSPGDGLTADDLVTNEFIDPSIGF